MDVPAGCLEPNGYIRICICGKTRFGAHRLIYAMFFYDPGNLDIDHIDGNRSNNMIENLRAVNRYVNNQNLRTALSNNKSNLLGVGFSKQTGKFRSRIIINKKEKYLGLFNTPEEAHSAYINAKRKHHEGCTI